jgi:hypothetical protein
MGTGGQTLNRCMPDCSSGCRSGYQCMTAADTNLTTVSVCNGQCSIYNPCPTGRACGSNGTCL